MQYRSIRGMDDILPKDIGIWQEIERVARRELESYGYTEIRTPLLEEASVFVRSIGNTTDIVTKEMYTFKDKKDRSLALRPEGTAPIVRAYIEHSLNTISPDSKFYYIGPMFRSERPQKGRSRQFHQIGVEVFGSLSPYADAEIIMQMSSMLHAFEVENFKIKLNSLGCRKDKDNFTVLLKKYLEKKKKMLCRDCRLREEKNVLRVLDCKNENCKLIMQNAPDIRDSLCSGCRDHFNKLKDILKSVKIKFEEVKNLVRGIDYYTKTVFEVTHPALGSQDAIGAGGRYDNLVRDLGGPSVGAIGYALGIERIIIVRKKKPSKILPTVFVATIGDEAKIKGIELAERMRKELGSIVLTDIKDTSLKSQMRLADKNNAKVVIIIGDEELQRNEVIIRDMATKRQCAVADSHLLEEVAKRIRDG